MLIQNDDQFYDAFDVHMGLLEEMHYAQQAGDTKLYNALSKKDDELYNATLEYKRSSFAMMCEDDFIPF